MKLGIMQPYFFPYLGYFDLINRTDRWIVFDTVKYSPRSWMNRNRVIDPRSGWQYLTVPVDKHAGQGRVCDVTLIDPQGTLSRIRGQLQHYRTRQAPNYSAVFDLVATAFARRRGDNLRDLNVAGLVAVCGYLGIEIHAENLSDLHLELPPIYHAGEWALEISKALGATEYVNAPGGRDLFAPHQWDSAGIRLTIAEMIDFRYACGPFEFIENLSILDVLMWNSPETVKGYLDRNLMP